MYRQVVPVVVIATINKVASVLNTSHNIDLSWQYPANTMVAAWTFSHLLVQDELDLNMNSATSPSTIVAVPRNIPLARTLVAKLWVYFCDFIHARWQRLGSDVLLPNWVGNAFRYTL